jgi:hypothetical protein
MFRTRTHVARTLGAACVFVLVACARDAVDRPRDEPALVFWDDTGSSAFGDVVLLPWREADLGALRESNPSQDVWQQILGVRVGDTTGLPMLGTYSVAGDTLRFHPRFGPSRGTRYVARFDSRALYAHLKRQGPTTVIVASWSAAGSNAKPSTTVRAVYPTSSDVPMNLLKMYVEFSAPMSTGRSYEYIKLYATGDSLVDEPFFTAGDAIELWDAEKTRLTVLFDPGRIKRDLKPNEQRGLPLRTGVRYRLVIDSSWPDAQGNPLVRSHEKRFRVSGLDRSLVQTRDWKVKPPRAGTRDSLVLDFPEPLDRALLDRLLVVCDSAGRAIPGAVAITDSETRWTFTPNVNWSAAPNYVEVDTELEDLAGNNLKKLFDVAPGDSGATGVSGPRARVPFTPRRAGGRAG